MEKERNRGLDLLRLLFMFMVCLLHVLDQGGVLWVPEKRSAAGCVFWFLEMAAYCAADGFAILSGYVASGRANPKRYHRLAAMWFQAFFYSFVVTALLTLCGIGKRMGLSEWLTYAFPVTNNVFWYFSAFFGLTLAAPLLDRWLFSLDEKGARKTFLVLILLFSVMGSFADAFYTHWGVSALWLAVLYAAGVLARRIRLFERVPSPVLALGWLGCTALCWGLFVFRGTRMLFTYISPTTVFSGLTLVILFSRLRPKGNLIARLSPLAFGIYLLQTNPVIWEHVLKKAFVFAAELPLPLGVLAVFGGAAVIFIAGLAAEALRSRVAGMLGIPKLCEGIVNGIDRALDRVSERIG